jgi:hypothetical protein
MFLDSVIWILIGFLPTYGAMELAWRIAKRRINDKERLTAVPKINPTIPTAHTNN